MQLSLQEKLDTYWDLSRMFNGHDPRGREMPTFMAIQICNELLNQLNPARPLYHQVNRLLDDIVRGEPALRQQHAALLQLYNCDRDSPVAS